MKYFFTVIIFLTLFVNSFSQDCNRYNIQTDPFTKISSSSAGEMSINQENSIKIKKESNTFQIELIKKKDVYEEIVNKRNINLPRIYNNTKVLFLLDNDEVLETVYTGRTVSASDPRNSDDQNTKMRVAITGMFDEGNSGRHTPYYISVSADINLSRPDVNKLKDHTVTMIRIQHNESNTDTNVSNQTYFTNFINCTE